MEVLSDFQVETAIKENKKALSTAEYDSEQGGLEDRIEEITTPMLNEFIEKEK